MNPLAPIFLVVMHLDLPPGDLYDSWIAVCATWNINCLGSNTHNARAGALRGDFTLNEAMRNLTHGTGFSYDFQDYGASQVPFINLYQIQECQPLWESGAFAHTPEITCYGPLTKP